MINGTIICGAGLILIALLVAAALAYMYFKRHPDEWVGWVALATGVQKTSAPIHVAPPPMAQPLPTDELPYAASAKERLDVIKPQQTVTLVDEGELAVQASVKMTQMWQQVRDGPWTQLPRAEKCTALVLSRDIWLIKVPSKEQGPTLWLKGTVIEGADPTDFFRGTKENPGPARQFRDKKQTGTVRFTLPDNYTPGIEWQMADIGALKVACDGELDELKTDDMVFTMIAKEAGGKWLVYLDARKPFATGTGGMFLCVEFVPSVEVKNLL